MLEILAVVSTVLALGLTIFELNASRNQREEGRVERAWNIIAQSASGARGNIGQRRAVELLREKEPNLNRIVLDHSYLEGVQLQDTDLWFASFQGKDTILERAHFEKARLNAARFNRADLREAHFDEAELHLAQFVETDLRGAVFRDADLRGANFESAVLIDANLSGANFAAWDGEKDGIRRETNISPKQVQGGCADPKKLPTLPDRPEFTGLTLGRCPSS